MYVYNTYTRVMHFNEMVISIIMVLLSIMRQTIMFKYENYKYNIFIYIYYVNVDLFYTSQSLPM